MTDSYGSTAGAGHPADHPADRVYDSYSDRDDNSSIAPFPPYRERDADDDEVVQEDDVVEQVVDAYGPVDVGIDDESGQPTPTPAATSDTASTGRGRLFSDAAQPTSPSESPTESPTSPTSTTQGPAKPPSPQPAPPPPYWKHSRDSSSSSTPPAHEPPCREQPSAHIPASASTSASATSPTPPAPKPKPKSKPRGLSIFARPASRTAAPNSKRSDTCPGLQTQPQSKNHNASQSPNQIHRRDTSSSTLEFNVNLITLQDNEADEPEPITSPASQTSTSTSTISNTNHAWLFGREEAAPPLPPLPPSANSKRSRCWARRVDIVDHVVINGASSSPLNISIGGGSHPRIGAFVVWTVKVETLDLPSSTFAIYKRYSEFDTLRRRLAASFPQARGGGALPPLPPKSVLGKFKASFLEQRRLGLQYFLNCILLNPEFAGSPILQEFLFE